MKSLKEQAPLTNEDIEKYWHIVVKTVNSYASKKMIPAYMDKDDLCQELYTALLEAIRRYNEENKIPLEAWIRMICGFRLVDYIRSSSWLPKTMFHKLSKSGEAIPSQYCLSDTCSAIENIDDIFSYILNVSLNEIPFSDYIDTEDLAKSIFFGKDKVLTKRNSEILYAYFVEEVTMKTIGEKYNLTESRVCQIISENLGYVQDATRKYLNDSKTSYL